MITHNEMVTCVDVEEIICPLCGAEQNIPKEEKWHDDSIFLTCSLCDCEFYCTRVITPIIYSTEYVEEE